MRIIEKKKIEEENRSVYDIQQMVSEGSLGILLENVVEELKGALIRIEKNDKLENYLTKYYRSAPAYIDILEKATNILYEAYRKG